MSDSPRQEEANELAVLVRRLAEAEAALQSHLAGQVDAILDAEGKAHLLHAAQMQLISSEATQRQAAQMQAAILDAIPAHIALITREGTVLAVNEAWRRFARLGQMQSPDFGVGLNYLTICEQTEGDCAEDAHAVAAGIRGVLDGQRPDFVHEYPCPSPTQPLWYRVMVTPLPSDGPGGAVVMHLDVTERRLAEEARLRHQALLRMAGRLARLGGWALDLVANTVMWTDETRTIHEVEADYTPTLSEALHFYLPEHRDRITAALQECLRTGHPFDLTAEMKTAKGRQIWVRVIGEVVRDQEGRITAVQGAFKDLTERLQMEQSLSASEARFRKLAEAMPMIVWTADADGQVDYANHHLFEYSGVSERESAATRWQRTLHPDDLPRCLTLWKQCVEQGERFLIEYRLRRGTDAAYRWFRVEALPMRNATGEVVKWYGTALDIDDSKRLEQDAIQLAETHLRTLESITDAFFTLDCDYRFTFLNREAERLLQRERADLLGQVVWQAFPDFLDGPFEQEFRRALAEGTTVTFEEYYAPLGLWVSVRAFPSAQGLAVYVRDITAFRQAEQERKKLEQQFLRAQRLESIGTLAGGIAHDLNNLLAPIMMGVDLIKEMDPSPELRPIVEIIERGAVRGAGIVKQVLSFARGVEGMRVTLPVNALLREVVSMVENTFPKQIQVEVNVDADVWPVIGDPTQLNQVLLNLCLNARDAMPQGGQLTLQAKNVEIDVQYAVMNRQIKPGRYVEIKVIDTGCGMSQEVMDRIFEPFFTTKELGKGTGLGLATTVGILRSHNGFVNVYSEPGQGSVFKVGLPAADDPLGAAADSTPRELPRGHGERVLVVDDEKSILAVSRQTLEAFGYRVLTAENGAQAMALFAQHREEIAVVITDMMMPVMDGPALIAALQRLNPTVRIIAASGLDARAQLAQVVHFGVAEFLAKPCTAEDLLTTLRRVLDAPPVKCVSR